MNRETQPHRHKGGTAHRRFDPRKHRSADLDANASDRVAPSVVATAGAFRHFRQRHRARIPVRRRHSRRRRGAGGPTAHIARNVVGTAEAGAAGRHHSTIRRHPRLECWRTGSKRKDTRRYRDTRTCVGLDRLGSQQNRHGPEYFRACAWRRFRTCPAAASRGWGEQTLGATTPLFADAQPGGLGAVANKTWPQFAQRNRDRREVAAGFGTSHFVVASSTNSWPSGTLMLDPVRRRHDYHSSRRTLHATRQDLQYRRHHGMIRRRSANHRTARRHRADERPTRSLADGLRSMLRRRERKRSNPEHQYGPRGAADARAALAAQPKVPTPSGSGM